MKLKIRYENVYQEIEINTEDMEQLWFSFNIEDEEMTEDRLQEEVEKQLNRPDYNNYHKHTRHWGMPNKTFTRDDEDADETDGLDQIADWSEEEERERQWEYEDVRMKLEAALPDKPDWVDMFMAIEIDGESVNGYADRIGTHPSNISHKLARVKERLRKIF